MSHNVGRRELLRAVSQLIKLSSKDLGKAGLMTVSLYPDGGLTLVSHASAQPYAKWGSTTGTPEASAVVLGALLERVLKAVGDGSVSLNVEASALLVQGQRLWTANVQPKLVPRYACSPLPRAVVRALREVSPFISSDQNRPHINCATIFGDESGQVTVQATDGHRAVRFRVGEGLEAEEREQLRQFGSRTLHVPEPVAALVAKEKHSSVAWAEDAAHVTVGALTCRCPSGNITSPPIGQVMAVEDWFQFREVPTDVWVPLRSWLYPERKSETALRLWFGRKAPHIAVALSNDPEQIFGGAHEALPGPYEKPSTWCAAIGLRAAYLYDALRLFDKDASITARFSNPLDPLHLTSGSTQITTMPMRL